MCVAFMHTVKMYVFTGGHMVFSMLALKNEGSSLLPLVVQVEPAYCQEDPLPLSLLGPYLRDRKRNNRKENCLGFLT